MIKKWIEFNESISNDENDLDYILNYVSKNISSLEIPELKNDIYPLLKESVNRVLNLIWKIAV